MSDVSRSSTEKHDKESDPAVHLVRDFEQSERCPDCGHFVQSVFDHIAGCPDDLGDPPSMFLHRGEA